MNESKIFRELHEAMIAAAGDYYLYSDLGKRVINELSENNKSIMKNKHLNSIMENMLNSQIPNNAIYLTEGESTESSD